MDGARAERTRIAHAPVVAEPVPALANTAEVLRTPCGDGSMVWRRWGHGTPLVLLHGAMASSSHVLAELVPLLSTYRVHAVDILGQLSTKYGHPDQKVIQLSGGNQQKVVLSKWLIKGAEILLLDEPSRGLDIGAKADLYRLVDDLSRKGASMIVASSELEEIYAACDRIWVFHEGCNIACFNPTNTDQDTILKCQILGDTPND